jgi:hypothetical protein
MDIQQVSFSNAAQGIPAYDGFGAPTLPDPDGEGTPSSQPGVETSFANDRIVRSGDAFDAARAHEGRAIDRGSDAAFTRGALLYDEDDGSFAVIVPRNDWNAGAASDNDPAANDGLMGVLIVA